MSRRHDRICDTCSGPYFAHDVPTPPDLQLCSPCATALVQHERYHSDGPVRDEAVTKAGGPERWTLLDEDERRPYLTLVAAGRIAAVKLRRGAR